MWLHTKGTPGYVTGIPRVDGVTLCRICQHVVPLVLFDVVCSTVVCFLCNVVS